jgi:hypothetical protein
VKLHAKWDGLLGTGTTPANSNNYVREIESLIKEKAASIQKELDAHRTFESLVHRAQP